MDKAESKGIASISNVLSGGKWDMASANFIQKQIDKGRIKNKEEFTEKFKFRETYSERMFSTFGEGHKRECRTRELLTPLSCNIDVEHILTLLRDHGNEGYEPGNGIMGQRVCMHAGWGPIRRSQTTGSMICQLTPQMDKPQWVTGTSAPCTSAFFPVWFDAFPNMRQPPSKFYSPKSLWWHHELLHRSLLADYSNRIRLATSIIKVLEDSFIEKTKKKLDINERKALAQECVDKVFSAYSNLISEITVLPITKRPDFTYSRAWSNQNYNARMYLPVFEHNMDLQKRYVVCLIMAFVMILFYYIRFIL